MQNRQGNINPSFLGILGNENLLGKGSSFFVSIYLIPASHVLDIYECLGFRGEKDEILVSHCLVLARYYIYCCKFKNISPSIREYAQQLKYNLEIEKQLSIVTDSQSKISTEVGKNTSCTIIAI